MPSGAKGVVLHKTGGGTTIIVLPGKKSKHDFRVKYREPGKRERTPKHIHLLLDLYQKLTGNRELTMQLRSRILTIWNSVHPAEGFPPEFQLFSREQAGRFESLDRFGDYSVEFLLAVIELIMIQERTNYPEGNLTKRVYEAFGTEDIFGVVAAATLPRQRVA